MCNNMYGEKNMRKLLKETKMKSHYLFIIIFFLHYFDHFYNNSVVSHILMPIYILHWLLQIFQ